MDKILVAGIDTLAGANLAAWLAGRHQVLGLSWRDPVAVAGCETAQCDGRSPEAAAMWVNSFEPTIVVGCGPAAESSWHQDKSTLTARECSTLPAWAKASATRGAQFTLVSSDAVFTGPWMFHRENSTGYCDSASAQAVRKVEADVVAAHPQTLIARTNVFGWAPKAKYAGLCDRILESLEEETSLTLECMVHGTPILATDLAEVLERAWEHKLEGLYHIGGGERVNPFRFACLLADQFDLSCWPLSATDPANHEFGAGECSLQTRRIRKTLDMPLPLIREGLARLYDQHRSGYRDRFGAQTRVAAKAA